MNIILGVDEVGRGPLAGPVCVGVAAVARDFDWESLPGVTDSKKLTANKRVSIYETALGLQKAGALDFATACSTPQMIDKAGIVPAIKQAMETALTELALRSGHSHSDWCSKVSVKLDGGLKAPAVYSRQETIIKGDGKEKVIGLASIVAKVTRDRLMEELSMLPEYEPYNFATHKGYGTKKHRAMIASLGLSAQHRVSFCQRVLREKVKNNVKS